MEFAPEKVYRNAPECILVLFDVRIPGGALLLHSERGAWAERGGLRHEYR